LEGSTRQPDDLDLNVVPFADIRGMFCIVTEKLDGANVGISFDKDKNIRLQNRGHYLTGGKQEGQFDLLKQWAATYQYELWQSLGDRFILFGEWLYITHSIHYTSLPDFFLAFALYDKLCTVFVPFEELKDVFYSIYHVPIIKKGYLQSIDELIALIGISAYSNEQMEGVVIHANYPSDYSKSLHCKYVRPSFTQQVNDDIHWKKKPVRYNQLKGK